MKRTIAIVLFITLFIFNSATATILIDRIVAVIDRDTITWSELYKRIEFEYSDTLQRLTPKEKRHFIQQREKEFLEKLIDIKVQLKEALKQNITVTDRDIDSTIAEIRKRYGLTETEFREAVTRQGLTYDEYRQIIGEQIIINKLLTLKLRSNILVSEEEIDRYIKEHSEEASNTEGYILRQIFIKSGEESERKLQEVLQNLKEGVPFDTVAKKYSEGLNSREGGIMGFVKKTDLDRKFIDALEKIKEGEYTEPLRSRKGIHILYLEKRIKPDISLRENVKNKLIEMKMQERYQQWIKELRKKHFIQIKL
jgi:peptidyl-prolyl cis-trans isomerase SurA